jgi:type I restriction enzyme S subunit
MTWRVTRLGDVLTLKRGHDLPDSQRQDGEVPVVSSSGVTGHHTEPKAKAPGVVTGRYGTLGEVFYIEEDYWPLNTALYVIDFKGNQPRFVAYFLENILRNYQSDKAAVPGVNRNVIHEIKVRCPDTNVQERIADILSAYDDLIENNRQRMALLEDAARQLYREWFVRLRFPGHEHTRITNGVPEGWEKATAYSAMEVLSGGTPKTTVPDYWDGEIPFYTPKDASDTAYVLQTERAITELGLKNCNSRLYELNTVFISARGTVGKLNLASRPMAMSQSCYALIGKGNVTQLFLFCTLKESIEHFKQHAGGAVFDAIVVDTFKLIPVMVPDDKKIRLFEEAVAPMFRQVANLMEQQEKLRAARDLLLPRLMTGKIAV